MTYTDRKWQRAMMKWRKMKKTAIYKFGEKQKLLRLKSKKGTTGTKFIQRKVETWALPTLDWKCVIIFEKYVSQIDEMISQVICQIWHSNFMQRCCRLSSSLSSPISFLWSCFCGGAVSPASLLWRATHIWCFQDCWHRSGWAEHLGFEREEGSSISDQPSQVQSIQPESCSQWVFLLWM